MVFRLLKFCANITKDIRHTFQVYGINSYFPKNAVILVVVEALTRFHKTTWKKETKASIIDKINEYISSYCTYQIILAEDSWVDGYSTASLPEVYDHLSRCMVALLASSSCQNLIESQTIETQELLKEINTLRFYIINNFAGEPEFLREVLIFLFDSPFIKCISKKSCVGFSEFFILSPYDKKMLDYFNVPIIASRKLGCIIKNLYELAKINDLLDLKNIEIEKYIFYSLYVKCAYFQANSVFQKDINGISWRVPT
jgi:uncharacterized protein YutD